MMVTNHREAGTNYRAQLVDIIRRAEALETHARGSFHTLDASDPQRITWTRIERRYATVRGNAQHLLLIHDWLDQRRKPLFRLRRYLNLL